jgi:hypothetical protein
MLSIRSTLTMVLGASAVACGFLVLPGTPSASQGSGPSSFAHFWGPMWYLRTKILQDDLTLVYGGVTGSYSLVFQDPDRKVTRWIMLDPESSSSSLVVVGYNPKAPWGVSSSEVGKMVTSTQFKSWQPTAQQAPKRDLTYGLMDLFAEDVDPNDPSWAAIHNPFLIGANWPGGGATVDEAKLVCAHLHLEFGWVDPNDPNKSGFVIYQDPNTASPGLWRDPTAASRPFLVRANGATTGLPPIEGSDPSSAVTLDDPPQAGGNYVVERSPSIGPGNRGTLNCPILGLTAYKYGAAPDNRHEIYFKIPTTADNRTVTVTQTPGYYDVLVLTLWRMDSSGNLVAVPASDGTPYTATAGLRPFLQFRPITSEAYYLMAEEQFRDVGRVRLHFEW